MADVIVLDEGTIILFTLETDAARAWWEAHVNSSAMTFGRAYVVEHRYAPPIINHMLEDELKVEVN